MTNLKLEQIKSIALELGITLSYKDEEGKRKRYTKEELIAKIEQFEKEESKEVNAIQHSELELNDYIINDARKTLESKEFFENNDIVDKCSMYPKYSLIYGNTLVYQKSNKDFILEEIVNSNPVVAVKSYIKNNDLFKVKSILEKLIQLSNDKKVKSIQRSNYKKYYNIITSMLKIKKVQLV